MAGILKTRADLERFAAENLHLVGKFRGKMVYRRAERCEDWDSFFLPYFWSAVQAWDGKQHFGKFLWMVMHRELVRLLKIRKRTAHSQVQTAGGLTEWSDYLDYQCFHNGAIEEIDNREEIEHYLRILTPHERRCLLVNMGFKRGPVRKGRRKKVVTRNAVCTAAYAAIKKLRKAFRETAA